VRASEGAARGGSFLPPADWLLIGNSRWHWAGGVPGALRCWSEPPAAGERASAALRRLRGWAAVGPVPDDAGLRPERRITLAQVPLQQLPPWLGVDRALAGWRAWRCSGGPVLVADAGTALSLTLVDGRGRFAGGRIQAGLALQLRALAGGTVLLPALDAAAVAAAGGTGEREAGPWPTATAAAMAVGVREGLVAAVEHAWSQARSRYPDCRLWITGGDGAWIAARLGCGDRPCLALEGLASLGLEADGDGDGEVEAPVPVRPDPGR
jgi:type III pantothenate kinase